jgi:hypothetical protein
MTLRLNDEDAEAPRRYAGAHSLSVRQAAQTAIRLLLQAERDRLIQCIVTEDAELLHRLAQRPNP